MSEHKLISLDDLAAKAAATGHSAFSPSGSKMWTTCLGSLIPNLLAEDETSPEAAEGTVAHSVAERWLSSGKRPKHLLGTVETVADHEIEIDEEMMAFVGDYVAFVQELEEDSVEFLIETRVDFSNLTPIPNQGGTADSIAVVEINEKNDEYELVVTDLKYGKGIRVIAEGNSQCRLYGYGAYRLFHDKYKITRVRIRICHPRLDGGITEEVISIDELKEFARYVKLRAHAAWQFDAPRTPSEAGCQWCKVRSTCPALEELLEEVTSGVFDDDEPFVRTGEQQRQHNEELEDDLGSQPFKPANPSELSTAALAKVLRYRPLAEKFFAGVEAELLERSIGGEEDVPGWKIVEGRSRRAWPDPWLAYLKLRKLGLPDDMIHDEVIITPAEAERRLKAKTGLSKESVANLVNSVARRPPGPKSLVRVSDKRDALPSDADVFLDDEPFERRNVQSVKK